MQTNQTINLKRLYNLLCERLGRRFSTNSDAAAVLSALMALLLACGTDYSNSPLPAVRSGGNPVARVVAALFRPGAPGDTRPLVRRHAPSGLWTLDDTGCIAFIMRCMRPERAPPPATPPLADLWREYIDFRSQKRAAATATRNTVPLAPESLVAELRRLNMFLWMQQSGVQPHAALPRSHGALGYVAVRERAAVLNTSSKALHKANYWECSAKVQSATPGSGGHLAYLSQCV